MGDNKKSGLSNGVIAIIVVAVVVQFAGGLFTSVFFINNAMRRVKERMALQYAYNNDYDDYNDNEYDYDSNTSYGEDIAMYTFNAINESEIAVEDLLGNMQIDGIDEPCFLVKKEAFEKYKAYSNVVYEADNQLNGTSLRFYSNPELMMFMYENSETYSIRIESKDKKTSADIWFYFLRYSIPESNVRYCWDDDAFLYEDYALDYISGNKTKAPIGYRDSKIEFHALQVDDDGAEWGMLGWIK